MENIVRRRYVWFAISLLLIIPGLVSLAIYGLRPGIDFSGGALWDIQFQDKQPSQVNTDDVARIFTQQGLEGAIVQLSAVPGQTFAGAQVRTKSLNTTNPDQEKAAVLNALKAQYGNVVFEQVQSVGATVSAESTRSAVIAVIGACVAILLYLTVAFRRAPHPVRYGICAILAMLHDVIVVMGVASILGVIFGLEVDALFLTALLTIISFSVHDTIVVFDRIRENLIGRRSGEVFENIVNHSLVQTLPRSINTQLTTLFTMSALLLFGGESIRHFVVVLLVGLISGTYSSIFNAAQLLVVWENHEWRNWFGRKETTVAAS